MAKKIAQLVAVVAVALAVAFGMKTNVSAACTSHQGTGTWVTITKATCTSTGKQGMKCSKCGAYITYRTINALGHNYNTVVSTKAATCTTAKQETKKCSRCSSTQTQSVGSPLGHSPASSYTTTKAATCTATGTKVRKCTRCNSNLETKTIAALGHSWNAGTVTKAATCTTDGVKTYRCTRAGCAGTKTSTIAKTGHNAASTYTVTKAPTCSTTGTKVRKCTKCSANLETVTIAALGHSWDSGTVTKAATCTTDGVKTHRCTRAGCAGTKTSTIARTGHTPASSYIVIQKGSCIKDEIKVRQCTTCGTEVERKVTEAPGHTPASSYIVTQKGSCTKDEIKERQCTICGACIEKKVTEAPGHLCSSSYIVSKEATCMETGTKVRKCTRSGCGKILETKTIPKKDHEYTRPADDENKSCQYHPETNTLSGVYYKKCTWCESMHLCLENRKPNNKKESKLVTKSVDEIIAHLSAKKTVVEKSNDVKFDGYDKTEYVNFLNAIITELENERNGINSGKGFVNIETFAQNKEKMLENEEEKEAWEKHLKVFDLGLDFAGYVPIVGDVIGVTTTCWDMAAFDLSPDYSDDLTLFSSKNYNNNWGEFWSEKSQFLHDGEDQYNLMHYIEDTGRNNFVYDAAKDTTDAVNPHDGDYYLYMTIYTDRNYFYDSRPNAYLFYPFSEVQVTLNKEGEFKYLSVGESIYTDLYIRY